jgi:hypothetical protein
VKELLLEVNAELEQGPDMLLVPDQQLVDKDPNNFQAMSIYQLKQWLLTVHQAQMAYWAHQHTADNLEDNIQVLSITLFENGSSPPLPTLPQTI